MFSNVFSGDKGAQGAELSCRKINIGCGYDKREGYLNLDCDPACNPDILVKDNDLSGLPRNHFEEIVAKDVLEHIPRIHMMSALFDWASLLSSGGTLYVQTSWIYGIIDIMRKSNDFETVHNWKMCLFGNQMHPGDWHCNGFTEVTLRTYLAAVGLQDSGFTIEDGWLISTHAKKVESWEYLIEMQNYKDYVVEAYRNLLGRDPEDWRVSSRFRTEAGSKARYEELRALVGSAERLYKVGQRLQDAASSSTTTS